MKGIIFNAVEEAVTELHGADTWDDLLDHAGVDGSYTALGTYPDSELMALVGAATEMTGVDTPDLLRVLGRHALPVLVGQVEELVDRDGDVFDFLASIHDLIHVEVKKLDPNANPPDIEADRLDDNTLQLTYRSTRGLPALAEGLIVGSGDMFEQPVTVVTNVGADDSSTVFRVSRAA